MSQPLPLASASQRLRRPPGRQRGAVVSQAPAPPAAPLSMRDSARTVAEVWPDAPRLLGLKAAARYVGVSTWTIRAWLADGLLMRVRLPGVGGAELDRLLLDRLDLDRLIQQGKA